MKMKMSLAQEIIADSMVRPPRKGPRRISTQFRDRQAPREMKEIVLKRLPTGISCDRNQARTESSHMATGYRSGPEKWSKLLAYLD